MPRRSALAHAVTEHDRAEQAKAARPKYGYYNPYALAQYLGRVNDVEADINAGLPPRDALLAGFNGRLLDKLLAAIGEPKATPAERAAQSVAYHRPRSTDSP